MCAAIRANGQLVFAHFASLARAVEHYGPLAGAAGGSSTSLTIFPTEQVFLTDCAVARRGLDWVEVAALPTVYGTCSEVFAEVLTDWRDGWLADERRYASRSDDRVGAPEPRV
jgi:hypothetical protein